MIGSVWRRSGTSPDRRIYLNVQEDRHEPQKEAESVVGRLPL